MGQEHTTPDIAIAVDMFAIMAGPTAGVGRQGGQGDVREGQGTRGRGRRHKGGTSVSECRLVAMNS